MPVALVVCLSRRKKALKLAGSIQVEIFTKRRILSDDTHLPCGFLTNADWFSFVFEFPPTTFPVNHGNKAVETGRNAFRFAVFYPHTEMRPMFAFTFAGVWLAHLSVLAVALRALPAGLTQPGLACCKAGRATRAWSERFFPESCPDGEVCCQGFRT
jgi:hypothetical protein